MSDLQQAVRRARYAPVKTAEIIKLPPPVEPIAPVVQSAPPEEPFKPYIVPREFPSIEDICEETRRFYTVTKAELCGARRQADLIRPRHVAMYLARKLTLYSLPTIGNGFGGRDHTTVLNACRKIARLLLVDDRLADEVWLVEIKVHERVAKRNAVTS